MFNWQSHIFKFTAGSEPSQVGTGSRSRSRRSPPPEVPLSGAPWSTGGAGRKGGPTRAPSSAGGRAAALAADRGSLP
eukprot:9080847-Alexandrium_andersonii.AAC.1